MGVSYLELESMGVPQDLAAKMAVDYIVRMLKKMTAEDRIVENGYEDVVIFSNPSYDDALLGISSDNRAVYSYDKMVEWLVREDDMTA